MNKNTFVIGDVHGCYYTLQDLIAKLPKNADLVFLGDLCDKGNYSKDVIEFVSKNRYRCVLGNHDLYMIKYLKKSLQGEKNTWNTSKLFSGDRTVESYRESDENLIDEHLNWLKTLPSFLEIDNFFITHGFGLPFYQRRHKKKGQFMLRVNRLSSMKYVDDWEENCEEYDVVNIFGHDAFEKVTKGKNYYGIDTGCIYKNKLTAIELNSMRVVDVVFNYKDLKDNYKSELQQ
jgi:serine/threonine protein phosphatase 1